MFPKIALLLCIALLLAACGAPIAAATPAASWPLDEVQYLNKLQAALDDFEGVINGALAEDPAGDKSEDVVNNYLPPLWMHNAPKVPATLAVVDYYRNAMTSVCFAAVLSHLPGSSFDCREAISDLHLELARLYAARGSYPPASQP